MMDNRHLRLCFAFSSRPDQNTRLRDGKHRCEVGQVHLVIWALKPLVKVDKIYVATLKFIQQCTLHRDVTFSVCSHSWFTFELRPFFSFFLFWASWNLVKSSHQICITVSGVNGCRSCCVWINQHSEKVLLWSLPILIIFFSFESVISLVWCMLTSYLDMGIVSICYCLSTMSVLNSDITHLDGDTKITVKQIHHNSFFWKRVK